MKTKTYKILDTIASLIMKLLIAAVALRLLYYIFLFIGEIMNYLKYNKEEIIAIGAILVFGYFFFKDKPKQKDTLQLKEKIRGNRLIYFLIIIFTLMMTLLPKYL